MEIIKIREGLYRLQLKDGTPLSKVGSLKEIEEKKKVLLRRRKRVVDRRESGEAQSGPSKPQ